MKKRKKLTEKERTQRKIQSTLIDKKFLNIKYDLNGDTFEGVNCITLVKLYLNQYGVKVKDVEERLRVHVLKNQEVTPRILHELIIKEPLKLVKELMMFGDIVTLNHLRKLDVVLFSEFGRRQELVHIGVMINSGWFLHILEDGKGSRIEKFNNYWINRFYGALRAKEVLELYGEKPIILEEI